MLIKKQNKLPVFNKIKENYTYKSSIIVPCYNTKPWLDECLQSLVDQTLQDIEIICVNDGSTDGTGAKLDEWQAQYPNKIKVIHQQNGGVSNARNAGMKIAQGECIGFVDSDDFVDVSMYEKLYDVYKDNNADVVKCDYLEFIKEISILKEDNNKITFKENLLDILMGNAAIWAGIYSNYFLQQYRIQFVPNLIYEDLAFQYETAIYNPIFYKTTECLYYYRISRKDRISLFNGKECFDIFIIFNYINSRLLSNINNRLIYSLFLKRKISLFAHYLIKIETKYKKKFLLQSSKELFENHKVLDIYKNLLITKYKKNYNYIIAPIFVIILHLCYLQQKIINKINIKKL